MKMNTSNVAKTSTKVAASFIRSISEIFIGINCSGNWHEPKMPSTLKK